MTTTNDIPIRASLESSWRAVKGTRTPLNAASQAGAALEAANGDVRRAMATLEMAQLYLTRAAREAVGEVSEVEPPRSSAEVADVAE